MIVDNVAKAIQVKRLELISQPLNRIYKELAIAAIQALTIEELEIITGEKRFEEKARKMTEADQRDSYDSTF